MRLLQKQGLAPDHKVSAKSLRCITYGNTEIELTFVEQLVEIGQAKAIMDCLQYLSKTQTYVNGKRTFSELIDLLQEELVAEGKPVGVQGLDAISRECPCPFHALPRKFEISAALNRLRTAKFTRRADDEETTGIGRPAKARRG